MYALFILSSKSVNALPVLTVVRARQLIFKNGQNKKQLTRKFTACTSFEHKLAQSD
jgi:hypothetical protein